MILLYPKCKPTLLLLLLFHLFYERKKETLGRGKFLLTKRSREREANKSEDTRLLSSAPRGGEARRGWFEASNVIVKSSTNESSGESGRSPYAAAIAIRR